MNSWNINKPSLETSGIINNYSTARADVLAPVTPFNSDAGQSDRHAYSVIKPHVGTLSILTWVSLEYVGHSL